MMRRGAEVANRTSEPALVHRFNSAAIPGMLRMAMPFIRKSCAISYSF